MNDFLIDVGNFQQYHGGWIELPDEFERVAKACTYESFGDSPAAEIPEADLPKMVLLCKVAEQVLGFKLPPRNQLQVGSCCGKGTARATEYSLLGAIKSGKPFEFHEIASELVYGGSRYEIQNGRVPFRGDGSNASWCVEFLKKYGMPARGLYGKIDVRKYTEANARKFGASGVPDELEPMIKKYPVREVARITTPLQARQALAQGYGITVASAVGFNMKRDANGVCDAIARWLHCMCCAGYAFWGGKYWYRIDNSWGEAAHTGPVGAGEPGPEGFYCSEQAFIRMLSGGDTWAIGDMDGFERRDTKPFWFF